jgi:GNAT superfamily N-acetyltransferase
MTSDATKLGRPARPTTAGRLNDRELARLELENSIAAIGAVVCARDDGLVQHRAGVTLLASGLDFRIFNQVIVDEAVADPGLIREAVETMRQRGRRWLAAPRVAVDGSDHRGTVAVLESLGLVQPDPNDLAPGMALHPIADMPPAPVDLAIARVTDVAQIADVAIVAGGGFGFAPEIVHEFITERFLATPGVHVYVGYARGEPVATSLGMLVDRSVGIYNVSTIEPARRRGYGTALTARAIADGAAAGADVATLQASAMGRGVYERLGFRAVVAYRALIDPRVAGTAVG